MSLEFVALVTDRRSVVGFLVLMTPEARLTGGDGPCVGHVTFRTWNGRVVSYPVEPPERAVARPAIHKRLDFLLLEMACPAG